MLEYTVEVPEGTAEGEEYGVRVRCEEHGASETFQPGFRRVAFHCEDCGYEVEVAVHDLLEWRDMGEMC